MSKTYYSICCLSSVRLYSGEEGTNHYICNACDEACDITDKQVSKTTDTSELDSILQEAIVGENFVSFNEHGQKKFEKAKTALLKWKDTEIAKARKQWLQDLTVWANTEMANDSVKGEGK